MEQQIEDSLLQAIKKDDIKAFAALMENARCEAFRLGRFPILSLLYLYKSRKILSEYEQRLLQVVNFEEKREPMEISKKFSAKARKCLRLYLDGETVSPLEMLLIVNDTKHLKLVYPMTKPTAAVRARLKKIYFIRYSLNVKFEGNDIIFEKRPLSYREKRKIVTVCLSAVLAVALIISLVTVLMPINGKISWYWQMNFDSTEEYTLEKDVVVPKNFSVDKVNCKISGNGKKLILESGASLGELNGELSDLTIESTGDVVFTSIGEKGIVKDVTLNVNAAVTTTASSAFLTVDNLGRIENVTVNVSGRINAIAAPNDVPTGDNEEDESAQEFAFGGIVQSNNYTNNGTAVAGVILNCTVNYSDFKLVGEVSANASFGGVAGINNGYLQDCTVTGEIIADTFDVAGICCTNSGSLYGDVNEANISQTSAETGWNPMVCGVVLTNTYAVTSCVNRGNISATADNDSDVYVGGIATRAYGYIYKSINEGNVTAIGSSSAYIGGISAYARSQFSTCYSRGNVTVTAKNVYAGGIFGYGDVIPNSDSYILGGAAEYCISECRISVNVVGADPAYVGGIAGFIREYKIESENNLVKHFGGRVVNCYFTGEYMSESSYFGNIVGVGGAHIYETNSYSIDTVMGGMVVGSTIYKNFDNNVYLNNSYTAFGATLNGEDDFAAAEDKGATAVATRDEIRNHSDYKRILSELNI